MSFPEKKKRTLVAQGSLRCRRSAGRCSFLFGQDPHLKFHAKTLQINFDEKTILT